MRISLSERFDASSGSAPAGRRSPFAFLAGAVLGFMLCAAPAHAAPPSPQLAPEKPLTNAEILGAVVRISVHTVANARSASSERERQGTGVVVEPGGLILTSALLVQEADAIVVTTLDARTVQAVVAAHDPTAGFAVLRPAAALGVRPLPVGHSGSLEPSAWVSVASAARQRTVSVATVVGKGDFAADREYLVEDAIFTAPLVHECAGAALVDGTGKLIGIGALPVKEVDGGPAAARGPGNVFIPVERFLPVLSQLARADGSALPRRPWLGLVTQPSSLGLVVTEVPTGSPAERGGLRVGDAITAVDGSPVRTHAELYRSVWRTSAPGTTVHLTIQRDGTTREIRIRAIEAQDYLIHRA